MKSFTSFTPYYAEDVTYSTADLGSRYEAPASRTSGGKPRGAAQEAADGDEVDLLGLLKALFKDEWENFLERTELDTATLRVGQYPAEELQRWASDRAQVLSRTVRGVMRYAGGLRVLGRLEGVDESELEWLVSQKFEYIVTCQLYEVSKFSARSQKNR